MAIAAGTEKSGKVVIRNVGLMLSGDIDRPILDADTVVIEDGLIAALGREQDCDTERAARVIDARGTALAPGSDRFARASGIRRLDPAPEPARLDRVVPARRRHHHGVGRRGAPARPSEGRGRHQGAGDHRAARVRRHARGRRRRRGQGAGRRAGDREGHGRVRLRRDGRGRRDAARRDRSGLGQGRRRGGADGRLGASPRHPEHHPHRRPVDPGFRADRRDWWCSKPTPT